MRCSVCGHDNQAGARFCSQCGISLSLACGVCSAEVGPDDKFCNNCGHRLSVDPKPSVTVPPTPGDKVAPHLPGQSNIERFIPRELAKKLEAARSNRAMEGERRVVTMLFCDLVGYTKLAGSLDPEETYALMDQVLEIVNAALSLILILVFIIMVSLIHRLSGSEQRPTFSITSISVVLPWNQKAVVIDRSDALMLAS